MKLDTIYNKIISHPNNKKYTRNGWTPVYTASPEAKIMIVGQAPGVRAQESNLPWNDKSGDNLREWLGVNREQFYDKKLFALVPMDFYYPGKGRSGDLPPRSDFAPTWHPLILSELPNIKLIILVGKYAQDYYLKTRIKSSLTETVKNFKDYLPQYFPLVHPSPRNNIWQKRNPWFRKQVIPVLQKTVAPLIFK